MTSLIGFIFCAFPQLGLAIDFQSSRTLSLAQGGRGGALLNDTVTLNPSMLGFQPVAAVSGTFHWTPQGTRDSDRTYNISIIDGKNQYANAGLSFTRRPDLDFIHFALARRLVPWLSFGVSAKRFSSKNVSGYDAGVSTSIALPPTVVSTPVQLGVTVDNLVHQARHEKYLGPRQFGIGMKVALKELLMLYGDVVENVSRSSGTYPLWSGGAELHLGGDLYARTGVFGKRESGWSLGGGWVGPKIGIGYGYQNKKIHADRSFQHAITMDLYM